MKIALLHLSDIHITLNENPILNREKKIVDAVKNDILDCEQTFIVTSGDIAFSGQKEEYKKAFKLIDYLKISLNDYSKKACKVITIPGNHDCKFDAKKEQTRKIVLDGLARNQYADLDDHSIDLCTEPQSNYFEFVKTSNFNDGDNVLFANKLLNILEYKVGQYTIIFDCYNSAWHSTLHEEQGRMSIPIKYFNKELFRHKADVIFSLIHHPLNWQNAINSRELRGHLDKFSDFVLSGHEHADSSYIRKSENDITYYVESGALQESNNPTKSEFSLLKLNLTDKQFQQINFQLAAGGNLYTKNGDQKWQEYSRSAGLTRREFEISYSFNYSFLSDPGSKFFHSQKEEIRLSDIFVFPSFRQVSTASSPKSRPLETVQGSKILDRGGKSESGLEKGLKVIVIGDEGSGKTTFCKYVYQVLWDDDYIPVYLEGKDINVNSSQDSFMKKVFGKIVEQYEGISIDMASQVEKDRIVLILDDFQQLKGSTEGRAKFIFNINSIFKHILITGNSTIYFEPITSTKKEFLDAFNEYSQYWIAEFGRDLRYKLVDKWNKIGRTDLVSKNDLYRMNDETVKKVDSIIGKNFLPPYPIYVLTIIQSLEGSSAVSPEYSLQGFYYDFLISESINKAISDKESISFYYNFIADYVFFLFTEKIRTKPLSYSSFEKFYKSYKDAYEINLNADTVLNNLLQAKVLSIDSNQNIFITYQYIYYFFIARYLSNRIHLSETKGLIKEMCEKLYLDEYSNVILFLVHLSKDPVILIEIQEVAKSLFSAYPICKIEDDVLQINAFIDKMPEQVIELIEVEKAREIDLEHKTKLDEEMKQRIISEEEPSAEDGPLDIIGQISFAFKAIDILGQVTKKHWGDLPKENKYKLAEAVSFP